MIGKFPPGHFSDVADESAALFWIHDDCLFL
jgi:hypothetical protein